MITLLSAPTSRQASLTPAMSWEISVDTVEQAMRYALEALVVASDEHPELAGMETTLTLLLIQRGRAFIGHSGDSRAYLIPGDAVYRLTEDHTRANYLIAEKALDEDAVIISWWSFSTPLWYGRWVEGRREDVTIIDDRDILDDGQLGPLVPVDDAQALADAMQSVLDVTAEQLEISAAMLEAGQERNRMDRTEFELGEISMTEWLRRLSAFKAIEQQHELLLSRQGAAIAAYNQAVVESL